jgi:hypothetical protein
MSRAHLYKTVQSLGGSLVSGASVTVCEPGSGGTGATPILQTIYTGITGDDTLSNPFLAASGVIDFYLDDAQDVDLVITYGSSTLVVPYEPVLPPADEIFTAGAPVTVTNGPSTTFVLAGTDATHASWVDPADIVPGSLNAVMPIPSVPSVGAANGLQLILWDGLDADGDPMPDGFSHIEVATDDGTVIGSMMTAGGVLPAVSGPFDFTLQAFNQAGNSGDPTDLFTYPPYLPPTFSGDNQTSTGGAGTADALPATPGTYLTVTDDEGQQWVIPAYAPPASGSP